MHVPVSLITVCKVHIYCIHISLSFSIEYSTTITSGELNNAALVAYYAAMAGNHADSGKTEESAEAQARAEKSFA